MTGTDKPSAGAQVYFEGIEKVFVRLRGAPLLLSPADWQVAKEWFEAGIPFELVQESLEAVFARRREREAKGRIQSLRYCEEEVWRAWNETRRLEAGGVRKPLVAMDVDARLRALADSLPDTLPEVEQWRTRLVELSGSADEVEQLLAELEAELLSTAERSLVPSDRERLAARVDKALAGLHDRLPEAEIESARDRIRLAALRNLAHLPILSLFSPEAQSGELDLTSRS